MIPELTDLVADHPFRERPRGQLMTAMARAGRIAEALKVYDDWRQVLNEELGVQPSPALRALHGGILRADPGLRPTSYATYRPGAPQQLPSDIPDFVGRQDVLDGGLCDNLLIVGPGGIGKSALAIRLADENQIRPLLPDDPGCAVVVTSRRHIPGLTTVELDGLSACDATTLLSGVAGRRQLLAGDVTEPNCTPCAPDRRWRCESSADGWPTDLSGRCGMWSGR